MTSQRAYRRPLTRREALSRLRAAAGVQFDPRVVGALLTIV
jgi:HD-GYP domain-containing protein (c-di-GMP phosphodiesterase class II)